MLVRSRLIFPLRLTPTKWKSDLSLGSYTGPGFSHRTFTGIPNNDTGPTFTVPSNNDTGPGRYR